MADCKCKTCRRSRMMNDIAINLRQIGATSGQYDEIEKAINNILDGREDGTGNKD